MPGCISISKRLFFILALLSPFAASAAEGAKVDRTQQSEEDDFTPAPFTEYGEFKDEETEEADIRFFQHGRFFGVGLGVGFQGVGGNRGVLWQGGIPALDFRVLTWLDFNVALDIGISTTSHFYTTTSPADTFNINYLTLGAGVRYSFDTKNASAAITFAAPYVAAGIGSYSKTETSQADQIAETDTAVGLNAGAGLEFVVKPRSTYFVVDGRFHFVTFKDTNVAKSGTDLLDLTGPFYTVTAGFLFTW